MAKTGFNMIFFNNKIMIKRKTLGYPEYLPVAEELKLIGDFFKSNGRMEWEMDWEMCTIIWMLLCFIMVKKEFK